MIARSPGRFLLILFSLIVVTALTLFLVVEGAQEWWVSKDLQRKSETIFEEMRGSLLPAIRARRFDQIMDTLDSVSRRDRFRGAMICGGEPHGSLSPLWLTDRGLRGAGVPAHYTCSSLRTSEPFFLRHHEGGVEYVSRFLMDTGLHDVNAEPGQTASTPIQVYIVAEADSLIAPNWRALLALMFIVISLGLVVVIVAALTARWTLRLPMRELTTMLRRPLSSLDDHRKLRNLSKSVFAPLLNDLYLLKQHAQAPRRSFEAGQVWTAERLRSFVAQNFTDMPLFVIANREPYAHERKNGRIEILRPASGLVTGVEPLVLATNGTWIAHGSGSADREVVDQSDCVGLPVNAPQYTLRRVWLSEKEEEGYYYGFSNEGLWPLCHIAHQRPKFEENDWETYLAVNQKFAQAFRDQNRENASMVLIQDYHFAPLPQLIRESSPDSFILLFWHIPWPNPEGFGICPWRREILEGMLAADVVGFHTQFHCTNFLDTVDRYVESRINRELQTIRHHGHECRIRAFPISIPWSNTPPPPSQVPIRDRHQLPAETVLAVGVDRIDYTKGIVERIRGVARFAERRPDLARNFALIQIGAPSRTHIPAYQRLHHDVIETANEVNQTFRPRFGRDLVILELFHHSGEELRPYYEQSEICLVTPLHDGMNLVAKEYVNARNQSDGVLILSQFAGASRELREALIVNPYSAEDIASKLVEAVEMPRQEQRDRMRAMRRTIREFNVYRWGFQLLNELDDVRHLHNITGVRSVAV